MMSQNAQLGRCSINLGKLERTSVVSAQTFHVLRPNAQRAWFVVDETEGAVTTPFWEPFPFDSLRRLPE